MGRLDRSRFRETHRPDDCERREDDPEQAELELPFVQVTATKHATSTMSSSEQPSEPVACRVGQQKVAALVKESR